MCIRDSSSIVSKGYIFLLIKVYVRVIGFDVIRSLGICDVLFIFGAIGMAVSYTHLRECKQPPYAVNGQRNPLPLNNAAAAVCAEVLTGICCDACAQRYPRHMEQFGQAAAADLSGDVNVA